MMKISALSLILFIPFVCCIEPEMSRVNNYNTNNNEAKNLVTKIYNCSWFTTVLHAPKLNFGHVVLAIQGKTNAERLTILTYGDGLRSDWPLEIHSDGTFTDTINISFTHFSSGEDMSKTFSSKTILKAYLGSEEFDTTLYSGKLSYE